MNKLTSPLALFAFSMLTYAVVLVAAILILREIPESPWQIPIALAPAIPGIFAALAISREIGRLDELQRRIQLEALAFAFAATAIVALSIGLLENAGIEQINGTFYVPIMIGLWGVGLVIASRRFR
ncbi:MAG: hypothetical protein IH858_01440 [Chloroflexi bacterium]|nr:hypothetical protein [Chloroflexota bacterium]